MTRTGLLRAAAPLAALAVLAAGCDGTADRTTIGAEIPAAPNAATTADPAPAAAAPAAAAPGGTAPGGTAAKAPATRPALRAPAAYRRAGFEIPLHPDDPATGTATVTGLVPAGWTARTRKMAGYGEPDAVVTIDRRDRTGALLVRYKYEPATGGGPGVLPSDDGSLNYVIDQYRQQAGVVVTVTAPPYQAANGLPEAECTVDLRVDGERRHALVAAWVLDDEVFSTYVSVPVGAEDTGRALYQRATDVLVRTHIDQGGG